MSKISQEKLIESYYFLESYTLYIKYIKHIHETYTGDTSNCVDAVTYKGQEQVQLDSDSSYTFIPRT